MEAYLLETGKFRLFASWFFRLVYQKDIAVIMDFFDNWNKITNGMCKSTTFHPFDIYSTLQYKWSYERFEKAMRVCMYTDLIQMVSMNHFVRESKFKLKNTDYAVIR